MSETKITSVSRWRRGDALQFLASGTTPRDAAADSLARALGVLYRQTRPRNRAFLWARRGRDVLAVAMVSVATGRVGFLYFSSSQAAGVDHDALVAVTRRAGQEALALGASLVQAVLPASSAADGALLQAAGFEHLAEMICLEQNLAAPPQASPTVCAGMTYETGHEISSGVWEELIAQTYQDSCDCPLLRGRRAMPDVVASLRLPGRYWPGHWYLVQIDGQRAGCLLINQATSPQSAEVAYLGVAPAFRGRGLSRAMLHHAMRALRREGILSLCLVVDAENAPARRVYQAAGFMEIERKQAFTLLPNRR